MQLSAVLVPSSQVHAKADHEALRQIFQDLETLASGLPQDVTKHFAEDMRLALLGVKPRNAATKREGTTSRPSKPKLQMEDELDHSYLDG